MTTIEGSKGTIVQWSNEVTIVNLSGESAEELDKILPSVPGCYESHILVNLSEAAAVTRDVVQKLVRLHYGLGLRGYKLVLFAARPATRQAFARMGVVNLLEFASDKPTALSWVCGPTDN